MYLPFKSNFPAVGHPWKWWKQRTTEFISGVETLIIYKPHSRDVMSPRMNLGRAIFRAGFPTVCYCQDFPLLYIVCYCYSAVVCLSWKSRENLVGNLVFIIFYAKQIVVLSSSMKLGPVGVVLHEANYREPVLVKMKSISKDHNLQNYSCATKMIL